jgi:transcriptional regulator with XRE-family HTH domain
MGKKADQELMLEDIEQWLAGVRPTEEVLAEFEKTKIDWDSDPEFVAGSLKALFVEDIYQAMASEGINRNELAQRLGKSRQYVSRILNESDNFTIDTLAKISCALNRNIALRLFNRSERLEIAPKSRQPVKTLSVSPRKTKVEKKAVSKRAAVRGRKEKRG